ncbi:hypothetical protein ACFLV7_02690 [Chloroflexota bacterium]
MIPLITFGLAAVLSLFFIPLIRQFSRRSGLISQPRDDRWHKKPTATLGGIGIFAAFMLSLGISSIFSGERSTVHWGIIIGTSSIFLLGLIDDLWRLPPAGKLVGQIIVATLVIIFGYTTDFLTPRIENESLARILNILLTYLWIVGITNAINLLDNMDGLAGGISLITTAILSYFFWKSGDQDLLYISSALAGSVLGFLVYNKPPASIFMGDSGSMFLGFTLAVLAISRQPQASNVFAVLGVPTILFLLPILDIALVTFSRLLRGESIFKGGRDHTSHRLIQFGLSERSTLIFLISVALVSGVIAALLESIEYWFSLILVPILIISFALVTAYLGGMKVLEASTDVNREKPITRFVLDLTFRRRLLEIFLDFALISMTYYLAFLTYYGFLMNEVRLEVVLRTLPVVLVGTYISFFVFGIYRGVWRYIDFDDFLRFIKASIGSLVIVATPFFILNAINSYLLPAGFSPIIILLYALFLFLGLAASRSTFRILNIFTNQQRNKPKERVLIYGARDPGEMALRWILMDPQIYYQPVGIIDNDPLMKGRQIHGVEVVGGIEELDKLIIENQICGVIIASKDHTSDVPAMISDICRQRGCWLRSLRLEFELLE